MDDSGQPELANAVLSAMRRGELPSDVEAESLDRMPLIDALRAQVTASDCTWLAPLIADQDEKLAGLAASLLKEHLGDAGVRRALERRWASASPYLKNRIMWRLLDCTDVGANWQASLQAFALTEWEAFAHFNRGFFGSGERAIARLTKRLDDPSCPDSKRWIYLYSIPTVVTDADSVEGLITSAMERHPSLREPHAYRLQQALAR